MQGDLINKRAALYTGCFANYYDPEVGEAVLKVLRKSGIAVIIPDQVCCGLPMLAKGNAKGAYQNMNRNVGILSKIVADGYALVTTCPSCSLMIKRDYRLLLSNEKAKLVSEAMFHFSEYLLALLERGLLNTDFQHKPQTVLYHIPCHLRAAGIGDVSVELLRLSPGITIKKITSECCGMGGTYGFERINYERSKAIASKLYSEIKENPVDRIVTDCGGCKLQIEAGIGMKVDHPVTLLKEAYDP